MNIDDVYCYHSLRAAQQFSAPLYVHRGQFKAIEPFAEGITEVYLVNLQRRKDRLDRFKTAHPNIKSKVYVSPAVDGRTLTLSPKLVECFRNNDFKWKKAVMGCALSHLALWEKLANDPLSSSYLILEDDVRLEHDWLTKWHTIAKSIPPGTDVIYLGGVLPPNKAGLPHFTEPVNQHFARVAMNSIFGGGPRRYFHFCNYSYILTQRGAQKLVKLVMERGIYTSGDHMIVNNGDYLNICFTTPLLATCMQEDDPIYQKSEFNNFDRVDSFDSDLWNNTDCFTPEEVRASTEVTETQSNTVNPAIVEANNAFLQAVVKNNQTVLKVSLQRLFSLWENSTESQMQACKSMFALVVKYAANPENPKQAFTADIHTWLSKPTTPSFMKAAWQEAGLQETTVVTVATATTATTVAITSPFHSLPIFHLTLHKPSTFLETEYLAHLLQRPIEFIEVNQTTDIPDGGTLIYQKIPGKQHEIARLFTSVLDQIHALGRTVRLLHYSDEFGNDLIDLYNHPAVKHVFRNYTRTDLHKYKNVTVLPLGYTNHRGGYTNNGTTAIKDRKLLWSFVGSADRPGRIEALTALKTINKPHLCELKETWSTPNKCDATTYVKILQDTIFVPCLRGSCALESYRMYEALEHGAIPVYVASESPHGMADEYKALFNSNSKCPLLAFPSWEAAATILPKLAENAEVLEKHRKTVLDWWQSVKDHMTTVLTREIGNSH
jgi:GR25 family glycosyltransferase involved in LPS biosynthesis